VLFNIAVVIGPEDPVLTLDSAGQPVSTGPEAASLYDAAVRMTLCLQRGALAQVDAVLDADPGFAVAHATKAALDFEQRDLRDCALHYHSAVESLARGSTAREQAYVRAVGQRIHGDRIAYRAYSEAYPEDPMGLALAIPTIAFSGAYDSPIDAWHCLDELEPLHRDNWWFTGLLAFARVEQGDLDGAAGLADRSLRDEPLGGTAAHARAHAYYELGEHAEGLRWLDDWLAHAGSRCLGSAHLAWHAVLHDLGLGDIEAVLHRYDRDLSPSVLQGIRSLVDGASLLWRLDLMGISDRAGDIVEVRARAGRELTDPNTAFSAMHAALADAAAGDDESLMRLEERCRNSSMPAMADLGAPLAAALAGFVRGEDASVADTLLELFSASRATGASRAQCEVIEDTAIAALVRSGRVDDAIAVLTARLDRRPHAGDRRLLGRLGQTTSC
jgi:tetratricopeptide (TPR) repeat protein